MQLDGQVALVTGGASGLGRATVERLLGVGAHVVVADLAGSPGEDVAKQLGDNVEFIATDVTVPGDVAAAVAHAASKAPLRAVVHTAGRGGAVRLVDRDGSPGDAQRFTDIVTTNLIGTYHVASHAAAMMADNDPIDGDRGAIVLTSSVAAYEGQVGQAGYAASKAGVVGFTICAARDLASRQIRVNTIAPGIMETPMLGRLREDIKTSLAASVPHPSRLGEPDEFAALAIHLLGNGYINGETVRMDGAIRMAPR